MSTPTACPPAPHGVYTGGEPLAPRQPMVVWSGILQRHIPKRGRAAAFARDGRWRVVLVESDVSATIALRLGSVYVGRTLPFEAACTHAGTIMVDTHSARARLGSKHERDLVLEMLGPGASVVDCSAGGTFVLPPLARLRALCRRRRPSHGILACLPVRDHMHLLAPGKQLAVGVISPGLVALIYCVPGGFQCPVCGWTGLAAALAAHMGVGRFMGVPRTIAGAGGGLGGPALPPPTVVPRGWRADFVRESVNHQVAWRHMPQTNPTELRRRLNRLCAREGRM